jgi:hypothetical protein
LAIADQPAGRADGGAWLLEWAHFLLKHARRWSFDDKIFAATSTKSATS